ncbi:hypothetical protein AVEN_193192-1 [Araneus ventricosus]|uniref:Uncharacterized protein n=1 Tax=Araneus ventricosus TaxID=182803 RepID=A0A4Y2B1N1_ARAVE|nr:hypothetical protein AVEN_193192-1 [Araneus ventricosus]
MVVRYRPRSVPSSKLDSTEDPLCNGFGLVILTSRFEATRGLFCDGPRNFEPWSDNEDDTSAGTPSPNFHATPTEGRLVTAYGLACNGPHTRRTFRGIGFRAWNPAIPRPRPCY